VFDSDARVADVVCVKTGVCGVIGDITIGAVLDAGKTMGADCGIINNVLTGGVGA
jgi:hypothetical protein